MQKDSSAFISWAEGCQFFPGYLNISNPGSGSVNGEFALNAIGSPDFQVVSLGDSGVALLSFEPPIANGPGFDFAVFENSFSDDFLELAFVEVSSDGENYFRFDAVSFTQTQTQVSSFGLLDATKLNNLAGKYRGGFGVPFDLEELNGIAGLSIHKISHVKITDVIGSIDEEFAATDSQGNAINDPWPTPFPSSGFDLDAVGVINNTSNAGIGEIENSRISVYPNPAKDYIVLSVPKTNGSFRYSILNAEGQIIIRGEEMVMDLDRCKISITNLPSGLYLLSIISDGHFYSAKFVKK